ncbi:MULTISPECIES: ribulokinase [unclassified Sporosarcina]|uniref:ribulokinase n=1 Tax=unclassified Sporosarcina TaxID=2647733 RepID=UPI00203BF237|nr:MULTISPECIES: ribulokinase [unclassified Sporosarcina]GKV65945.1 ribulokinase [Sporosarcina sp. NCCP-2331]GLB56055.1 ribulokinase [Sporosarcina sp. NCCP-2378]
MENVYTLGADFGSTSCRTIAVDVRDGRIIGTADVPYKHGVLTEKLPNGDVLQGKRTALQVPGDYVEALKEGIHSILEETDIEKKQIIGMGIDFTASTILPVGENFQPLCEVEEFKDNPHAYVKLWKHHDAERFATRMNDLAQGEEWIKRYGGKISAEWMLPKISEITEDAPEVFEKTQLFLEASDWIVAQLTGELVRNSCAAGYKGCWHKKEGYLPNKWLKNVHPSLDGIYESKLQGEVLSVGSKAGSLQTEMAQLLGLNEGIAVSVGVIDAHAALPGLGVKGPGEMVVVMGTSTCHLLLDKHERKVTGISGVVEDGIIPGFFAYEAGQAAVGDLFAWYVDEQAPQYVREAAEQNEVSIHDYLSGEAAKLNPGQSGLVALDWINGSRTPYVNMSLSGAIVGIKLSTTPAEVYRAYLESTAFGTRVIVELFEENQVKVERLIMSGGIPQKNPFLMQLYADILQKEIIVDMCQNASALGAAILAAASAGAKQGGYGGVTEAISKMSSKEQKIYYPNEKHKAVYDELFRYYKELSEYFAKGSSVMSGLTDLKSEFKGGN